MIFLVELPYPASEIDLIAGDDFEMPQWQPVAELKKLALGPAVQARLRELGHLNLP